MATVYNKRFEKGLIVLTILFGILSFFDARFYPLIFIIPAIIFFIRVIKDFRMKNDKQASHNLKIMIIFIIALGVINKLSKFVLH